MIVLVYGVLRLSRGLEATFYTRSKYVKTTFGVVAIYVAYGTTLCIFYATLNRAVDKNYHSSGGKSARTMEGVLAFLVGCRGFVDSIVWYLMIEYCRPDHPLELPPPSDGRNTHAPLRDGSRASLDYRTRNLSIFSTSLYYYYCVSYWYYILSCCGCGDSISELPNETNGRYGGSGGGSSDDNHFIHWRQVAGTKVSASANPNIEDGRGPRDTLLDGRDTSNTVSNTHSTGRSLTTHDSLFTNNTSLYVRNSQLGGGGSGGYNSRMNEIDAIPQLNMALRREVLHCATEGIRLSIIHKTKVKTNTFNTQNKGLSTGDSNNNSNSNSNSNNTVDFDTRIAKDIYENKKKHKYRYSGGGGDVSGGGSNSFKYDGDDSSLYDFDDSITSLLHDIAHPGSSSPAQARSRARTNSSIAASKNTGSRDDRRVNSQSYTINSTQDSHSHSHGSYSANGINNRGRTSSNSISRLVSNSTNSLSAALGLRSRRKSNPVGSYLYYNSDIGKDSLTSSTSTMKTLQEAVLCNLRQSSTVPPVGLGSYVPPDGANMMSIPPSPPPATGTGGTPTTPVHVKTTSRSIDSINNTDDATNTKKAQEDVSDDTAMSVNDPNSSSSSSNRKQVKMVDDLMNNISSPTPTSNPKNNPNYSSFKKKTSFRDPHDNSSTYSPSAYTSRHRMNNIPSPSTDQLHSYISSYLVDEDSIVFDVDNHKFLDHRPSTFQILRNLCGLHNDLYMSYILTPVREKLTEGSSGAFMFNCGSNDELLVKTVSVEEKNTLLRILHQYTEHLHAHQESLLVRFLGLHTLTMYGNDFNFVVMKNIFPPEAAPMINERYDIKGSYVNRNATVATPGEYITCRYCNEYFLAGSSEKCFEKIGLHEPK